MLADLLGEFVRDFFIGVGVSIQNKIILLVFGLLMVAAGLLFFCALPPIVAEDYYSTEISYSRVYYDDRKEYLNIVLVSGSQNYNIYHQIWHKEYSPEIIVDELAKDERAKIWLSSPDSHEIKGITTPTFSIEPLLGVAWDNENRGAFKYLAWLFIGLGGFLIVTLWISPYLEKRNRRKRRL